MLGKVEVVTFDGFWLIDLICDINAYKFWIYIMYGWLEFILRTEEKEGKIK